MYYMLIVRQADFCAIFLFSQARIRYHRVCFFFILTRILMQVCILHARSALAHTPHIYIQRYPHIRMLTEINVAFFVLIDVVGRRCGAFACDALAVAAAAVCCCCCCVPLLLLAPWIRAESEFSNKK